MLAEAEIPSSWQRALAIGSREFVLGLVEALGRSVKDVEALADALFPLCGRARRR